MRAPVANYVGPRRATAPRPVASGPVCMTVPYPPSANRYWRHWRNRVVISDQARDYRRDVQAAHAAHPLAGPVAVTLHVYRPARRGDLDNTLKVLLDALQGIAYLDDSQVVELHAHRGEDKHRPRVEVEVHQVAP